MSILVVDVGTSGVRAAVIDEDATIRLDVRREVLPDSPMAGLVEFDASVLAEAVLATATEAATQAGDVTVVGIANQRASTVVWDRATGEPVAPALGWQDLRTVGECLVLQGEGIRLAPNQSATKLAHLLDQTDAARVRDLAFGTVDTWVAWTLSEGAVHVTDASNASVTGLTRAIREPGAADTPGRETLEWDESMLERLAIPPSVLPTIVDSSGAVGEAVALPGAPVVAGMVGDQQSSLIGQACVRPGLAKITFGTGGMLDVCVGDVRPGFEVQGGAGCFPLVAWRDGGGTVWGVEAIMLAAGTNVEWLRDDLGLIATAAESHDLASSVADAGGVTYVPAPLGLGTPRWDFGARGTLVGLTRGTTAAHVVRAVLEGVAHRGADLADAAEADTGHTFDTLRVDGGMSANPTFLQALADATQRPIEVAPVTECTTLGAAYLAGLATGGFASWDEVAASWAPQAVVEPGPPTDRDRWRDAVDRAAGWFPDLSALSF